MSYFCIVLAILASLLLYVVSFEQFNDNVLFGITWAGPLSLREGQVTEDGKDYISSHDAVLITTPNNEKYHCLLPSKQITNKIYSGEYGYGPSPEQLLAPLTDEARCSYRLEAYWTYELCHNKHVRQFHDERTQKGVKLQEFYLGKLAPEKSNDPNSAPQPIPQPSTSEHEDGTNKRKKPRTRKLEGRDMPYYEVVIGNGTPCDLLGGRPREIHILYLCHPQGNNEILSIKEISTCIYEMEVITPTLCSNEMYRQVLKQYKFQEDPINEISCHSLGSSLEQPQSYTDFLEQQELERSGQKQTMLFEQGQQEEVIPPESEPQESETPKIQTPLPDDQLTRDFLNGDYCLQGGTGWWKYELCLGKKVIQFHIDEEHIKWVQSKNTKPNPSYAVHLYTGGDTCDLTDKPRQVQVRLRCKESSHLQEVSIYLMEPEVCHYILGVSSIYSIICQVGLLYRYLDLYQVESPIICPLLERMDSYELFT
ncbi:hypothetical protein QZH41_017636 [Actinostola sp. cb2023]|nr:hypothetical protein QZH41_017636 [Actinostola sp. cb2023]